MTLNRPFASLLVAVVLLSGSVAKAINIAPSALAVLASGELVVLDTRGLFRYNPKGGAPVPFGANFGLYQGRDLQITTIAGVESIWVTQRSRASHQNRLVQFDANGRQRATWILPGGQAAGVAIDTQSATVYIVNSENGEVLRLEMGDRRPIARPMARIPTLGAPASAVFDARRRRLLVADAALGLVWSVNVESKRSARLLDGLGTPSALAIDPKGDRLYITDASRGRVLRVDLATAETQSQLVARMKNAKDVRALAVDRDGNLWLGASTKSGLWQLSTAGEVIRDISF